MINIVSKINNTLLSSCYSSSILLNKSTNLLLFNNNNNNNTVFNRFIYTFRLSNKLVRNKRTTRPKKTTNNSFPLNYEQAQFAEKIGVTKSWNSWNTCKFIFIISNLNPKNKIIYKL